MQRMCVCVVLADAMLLMKPEVGRAPCAWMLLGGGCLKPEVGRAPRAWMLLGGRHMQRMCVCDMRGVACTCA